MKCYLGVDVGSLTVKFVLIDAENKVLFSRYFRTEGKLIEAIKKGVRELKEFIERHNPEIEISQIGTTGSGRYLAGAIIGADLIKNEVTAHAKGVTQFFPSARTVIEIGGQDSKIIILEQGVVIDFALNLICLPAKTGVISENYVPKPIEEIKRGEKVLSHLGRFREVEEIFERDYSGELIEIENSKLKTLKLTPEHPVLALTRENIKCYYGYSRKNIAVCRQFNGKICKKRCAKWKSFSWIPSFIPAKTLRKGDFICTPLSTENELDDSISLSYQDIKMKISDFEKRAKKEIKTFEFSPDLLRFLGYYLAEGSIQYNRARWKKKIKYPSTINFVFNISEEKYAKEIKEIIEKNFKGITVQFFKKPCQHTLVVNVYSKPLSEFVKYLCGSMADKKMLSKELLNLPPVLQKEILRGFFRGDGHLRKREKNLKGYEKKGNRYIASTTSKILAHQLYWLLLRNKIKCTLRKTSKKTKGDKWGYLIDIYGEDINKLEDREIIHQKIKKGKSFIYSNWLFEPTLKIKKYNFKGKVYNLKVKEDDSYIANLFTLHNCSAGTGAFLDAQSFRLGIPVEKFGELALKSKSPTTIGSRCSVFAESDMIHKQQIGHKIEDIVAGLCQGLARNYLAGVGKGKKILPPIVFLGGVSENVGMRRAFNDLLNDEIIVPPHNTVMGALGAALLAKENHQVCKGLCPPTKFRGFEISDKDIKCASFQCKGCPNQCEVIEARIEEKVVARWGDRCGKWSNLITS